MPSGSDWWPPSVEERPGVSFAWPPSGTSSWPATAWTALAFLASRHSERVTATDVNPRALAFARFNATLNQVANVDLVEGPWFEPVASAAARWTTEPLDSWP
ncbi:MAG: hypothetical protein ACRDV9_05405 [Acidimicrobiia bacterium]